LRTPAIPRITGELNPGLKTIKHPLSSDLLSRKKKEGFHVDIQFLVSTNISVLLQE
jgi:hypothetical protein